MTFFSVVFGVMAVSIFFIHQLSDYCGCRLEYKSLLLCAVMAMTVAIGSVLLSPYLTQGYYVRLGILLLAASAIVTVCNEYLQHPRSSLAAAETTPEPSKNVQSAAPTVAAAAVAEDRATSAREEPEKISDTPEPPGVEEPVNEENPVPAPSAEQETGRSEEIAAALPQEKDIPSVPETAIEEEIPPELLGVYSHLDSLDDILDYAYEQRSSGNIQEAILANRKALERYIGDSYAPFIAIELGNIYKEQADYDAAIDVYEKALDIPAISGDDNMYQEFAKNLSYLRTVQYVLSRHNTLDLPFQDIPREYMEEIEADFQSRHTGGSSSDTDPV